MALMLLMALLSLVVSVSASDDLLVFSIHQHRYGTAIK